MIEQRAPSSEQSVRWIFTLVSRLFIKSLFWSQGPHWHVQMRTSKHSKTYCLFELDVLNLWENSSDARHTGPACLVGKEYVFAGLVSSRLEHSQHPLWHLDTQDLQKLWFFSQKLLRDMPVCAPCQVHWVSDETTLSPVTSILVQDTAGKMLDGVHWARTGGSWLLVDGGLMLVDGGRAGICKCVCTHISPCTHTVTHTHTHTHTHSLSVAQSNNPSLCCDYSHFLTIHRPCWTSSSVARFTSHRIDITRPLHLATDLCVAWTNTQTHCYTTILVIFHIVLLVLSLGSGSDSEGHFALYKVVVITSKRKFLGSGQQEAK